jgi:hypothetical protein
LLILNVFFLSHELITRTLLAVEGSNVWQIPHVFILFDRPDWVVDITFVLSVLQWRRVHVIIFSFRASEFVVQFCLIVCLIFILLYWSYLFLSVALIVEDLFFASLFLFGAADIKHCPVQTHLYFWGTLFYFCILYSYLFKLFEVFIWFLHFLMGIFLLYMQLLFWVGLLWNFNMSFL